MGKRTEYYHFVKFSHEETSVPLVGLGPPPPSLLVPLHHGQVLLLPLLDPGLEDQVPAAAQAGIPLGDGVRQVDGVPGVGGGP